MGIEKVTSPVTASPFTVDRDNPWPGLESFREADQDYFQGRKIETEDLLLLVLRERLTVLFGRSGLGKSSLLQAGLFPLLRHEAVFPVYIRLDFSAPEPDLVLEVKNYIDLAAKAAQIEAPKGKPDETLWEYFHRQDNDFWNPRNRPVVPLLVFDQFEEIFTRGYEDLSRIRATETFIEQLADLTEGRPPAKLKAWLDEHPDEVRAFSFSRHHYKILLSIREDFLPDLEALRARMPALALNRFRLRSMNGKAALLVVNQAQHLIEPDVAEQVIRFVAADRHHLPLADLEVEPALLSVVCRELNNKRQKMGEPKITVSLLKGSQEQVLTDLYEQSVSDLPIAVRHFIEDRLLTVSGYRDSVALDNALSEPRVTRQSIDLLVERRILRREGLRKMQRLELTHDLLTGVIMNSRDRRHKLAEEEKRAVEIIQKERARRLRLILVSAGLLAVISTSLTITALMSRNEARRSAEMSEIAREREFEARQQAKLLSDRIEENVKLRQALLTRDKKTLVQALKAIPLDEQVKFRATRREYPYKSVAGLPTYKFQIFPVEQSIPNGSKSIALITYIMNHPTFLNPLILTGPDTKFTATYDGLYPLNEVTALIEYADVNNPLAIARINMSTILETLEPIKYGKN